MKNILVTTAPLPAGTKWATKKGKHIPITPKKAKVTKLPTSAKYKYEGKTYKFSYEQPVEIPLEMVQPEIRGGKSRNPRKTFDKAKLQELGESIKKHGLLQPIAVRPTFNKKGQISFFEIIAGERRTRASKQVGLKTIKAVVFSREKVSDKDAQIMRIMENETRVDITPMEQAVAIEDALKEGLTYKELAGAFSKSESWVKLVHSLLQLDANVKGWFGPEKSKYPLSVAYEMAKYEKPKQVRALKVLFKHSTDTPTDRLIAIVRTECMAKQSQTSMFGALFEQERSREEARTEFFGLKKKNVKEGKTLGNIFGRLQNTIAQFWSGDKSIKQAALARGAKQMEKDIEMIRDMKRWLGMVEREYKLAQAEEESFKRKHKSEKLKYRMQQREN